MEQIIKARNNFNNGFELIKKLDKIFERWQKIEGYENYSVSTFGNVRNDDTDNILKNIICNHGYYEVCLYKNAIKKNQLIHRLVANAFLKNPQNKKCVDHIDRNKTNNHFLNLRYATHSENGQNKNKQSNNTSGFTGVSFHKSRNKYIARYKLNKKEIFIGYYKTAIEASVAYKSKIKKIFGEFANL